MLVEYGNILLCIPEQNPQTQKFDGYAFEYGCRFQNTKSMTIMDMSQQQQFLVWMLLSRALWRSICR